MDLEDTMCSGDWVKSGVLPHRMIEQTFLGAPSLIEGKSMGYK